MVFLVVGNHGGIVHPVDVVAGENQHIVGIIAVNEVDVLVDGVGSALIPAALLIVTLIRLQNLGTAVGLVEAPGLTVADVLVELQRLILGQDAHGVNAGIDAVAEGEINDAVFTAKGNSGLSGLLSKNL